MFMDFKQFEYVLTIAKEKSFSKAAKKLYISQPSLSQYINRLESNLKVCLFDRTTNPLKLTYEGEIYIETASSVLKLVDNMLQQYEDINKLSGGKLNIGVTPSKSSYLLPKILPMFKKEYPGIKLTLTESTSDILEELIIKDLVDICLMNLPLKNNNIIYKEILSEKILIAVSLDSKNARNDEKNEDFPEINIADLKNKKFVLLRPEQRIRQIADKFFAGIGLKPDILLETSSIETSIKFTEAGMGMSFVPESSAVSNLSKRIRYYKIGNPPLNWITVVAYKENTHITKAAQAFMKMAENVIKQV